MKQNSFTIFVAKVDKLQAETAVLDAVIRDIVAQGQKVTTKTIILYLIAELESTMDVLKLEILRNTLEMVVGRTPYEEGI